jgi:predicted RNA-binding protein
MCEFKVILDGKKVFEDVVYVRDNGKYLIMKDVIGEKKEFHMCRIIEINVDKSELVISKINF